MGSELETQIFKYLSNIRLGYFVFRGFPLCGDNPLMFILRLVNPGCSHIPVLAAKQNHLGRTEMLLTRAASGRIGQLLPTSPHFFSIIKREDLSDTCCFQETVFRIHKHWLSWSIPGLFCNRISEKVHPVDGSYRKAIMKCHKQFVTFRHSWPSAFILLVAHSQHAGLCVLLLLGKLCLLVISKEERLISLLQLCARSLGSCLGSSTWLCSAHSSRVVQSFIGASSLDTALLSLHAIAPYWNKDLLIKTHLGTG